MEQLKQQVNAFREHINSLMKCVSDVREELGILRNQIKTEARANAAPRADFMPHTTDVSLQADGPDTLVWDGTGVVPKDVTKVRIAEEVTSIGYYAFSRCTEFTSITMSSRLNVKKED